MLCRSRESDVGAPESLKASLSIAAEKPNNLRSDGESAVSPHRFFSFTFFAGFQHKFAALWA